MTMAVGFEFGPDEEDPLPGLDAAELGCPEDEDLHDADDVPPPVLLLAADPRELPGQWVDAGLSSWFAHTNQTLLAQARWLLETSRAQAGTTVRAQHRRRPGKIIAATLGWSETHATARLEFARQLLERLPALGAAMATGVLEEHKAGLFTTTLADLDTPQARTVVDRILPAAPRLPFGVLRARIEQAAEDVDPDWAAARRAAAITRRRVSFRIAPSGAAELCGLDLPEEPAQDAHDRIVALARIIARRLRSAGLNAPVGPIQSEVMLTLTGPAGAGMWDRDVIDHIVERFNGPTNPDDDDPDDNDDGPADDSPDDGPADGGPDDAQLGEPSPDSATTSGTATRGSAADTTGTGNGAPWRVPFVPRVALRVGLRTVLGLDRRSGEIPGHGPITNPVAVSMAWHRTHSSVRLLLYHPDGALEYALTVHPPRRGQPLPHAQQRRHHIVELTAYTGELDTLAAALDGEHLAFGGDPPPGGVLIHGDALGLLARAAHALAAARARPIEDHPAHTIAELGHRFPSAALRAWVQARDRTCRSPGCATDAARCDIDHTLPVTHGGQTRADHLGPVCRRDHTFKHDPDTGWTVQQTSAGRFAWTAPTGRVHIREPEPHDPGPDPVPRSEPDHDELPGPTLDPPPPVLHPPGSPRRNKHGYLTQAAVDTAAHLRQRARDRTSEQPDNHPEPEPDPEDRFPEEPPF